MLESSVETVKADILQYLISRPAASDDLEGITRFWVARQRLGVAAAVVEQAVEALVDDGLLQKKTRRTPAGKVLGVWYQLRKKATEDS
jgi:hypothetical protein